MEKFIDSDSYIAFSDEKVQPVLLKLKQAIEKAAPDAITGMAYGIPSYKYKDKPLAYFAANRNHVGFYPTPGVISAFEKELSNYTTSKGAVQFPYHQKLPVALITKMVKFRKNQINESSKAK